MIGFNLIICNDFIITSLEAINSVKHCQILLLNLPFNY